MVPVVFGRHSEGSGGSVRSANVVAIAILLASAVLGVFGLMATGNPIPLVAMILVGIILMQSPRIAQWERAVVLRLGRLSRCPDQACSGSCPSSTACRHGS